MKYETENRNFANTTLSDGTTTPWIVLGNSVIAEGLIPTPPDTGTQLLRSVDGELLWKSGIQDLTIG